MTVGLGERVGDREAVVGGELPHPVDVGAEIAFESAKADIAGDLDHPAAAGGHGLAQRDHLVVHRRRCPAPVRRRAHGVVVSAKN